MAKMKCFTVCGCNGDIPFSLKPIFSTSADAAKAIAREVNARFKAHGMTQRVTAKSCSDGFMQMISPNIIWTYKIIAHEMP